MLLNLKRLMRRLDLLDYGGAFFSVASFSIIVFYAVLLQRQVIPPFMVSGVTWEVNRVTDACSVSPTCPRVGDKILRIGEIYRVEGPRNRTLQRYKPFETFSGGVEVVVEEPNGGGEKVLLVQVPPEPQSAMVVLNALCFPLIFWGMGTICLIFLRPRNERWWVLVLFQFNTALWLSSGFLGATGLAFSGVLFRLLIWFFMPLIVHLHLVLPDAPLRAHHRYLLYPLYALALGLLITEQFLYLPSVFFLATALFGICAALGILLVRQFVQKGQRARVSNRLMLYGVAMGLSPIMLLILSPLLGWTEQTNSHFFSWMAGLFFGVTPIWPLTYILVIYRHREGTFEFRANRLVGVYGFLSIFGMLFPLLYHLAHTWWNRWGLEDYLLGLVFAFTAMIVAPSLYTGFQRFVDRRIFRIKYRPNEVISLFAAKIPSAFDLRVLEGVIVDEILPTLLIRQSALYEILDGEVRTVYEQGVVDMESPEEISDLQELRLAAGMYLGFDNRIEGNYSWVRLVIPLTIQGKPVGLWLLGRRDPDDHYGRSDIELLSNLANQIAPVMANLRLLEKAQKEVETNKKLQLDLVQAQKMEAIGRLSAGVAHDFNNILSVIIGYSNLVITQYGDNEQLRQSVMNIKDAGERAATLTKQLLAFSRKQVMEARIVNLERVVTDVEKMLRRLTGEDIELVTRVESDLPNVRIDPSQMGQVIINLVVNARDAMPDGGRVTIDLSQVERDQDPDDLPESLPIGAYVHLRVADDGAGMEPELLESIFEPYFTTKERGKGTGLGLSMVYGFIDRSSGYTFVNSLPGQGTAFDIYLPAVSQEEAEQDWQERQVIPAAGGSEHILLVEDEDSVRAVTSEILTSDGYQVVEARNGEEALACFERRGPFDLLLTDVVMPHMKGTELARRLLEQQPRLRVVYMSGYNEESFLGRRIGEGDFPLIQKPFSTQELIRRVRLALDEPPALTQDMQGAGAHRKGLPLDA